MTDTIAATIVDLQATIRARLDAAAWAADFALWEREDENADA